MVHIGTFNADRTALSNRVTTLFQIKKPIIQAGMIWASGWRLASAVSEAGGLGIIGAGSMYPEVLEEHLIKMKQHCDQPYAVNLPLLYPDIEKHVNLIIKHEVPIVFTSAGNPKIWTSTLKQHGVRVVHVVSSTKFALKCQDAGVDAVVAEGFEAGGHNGREETTTMVLIPHVRKHLEIPLISAGGIGCGKSMLAAMILGAEAVQIGSRFVCSLEASSHNSFKEKIIESQEGDTELVLKKLTPVRLLKNDFYQRVKAAEVEGESTEGLAEILGRGRAKLGMFEGNMQEGELEIGQVAMSIRDILPAYEIVENIWNEFQHELITLKSIS